MKITNTKIRKINGSYYILVPFTTVLAASGTLFNTDDFYDVEVNKVDSNGKY